VIAALISVTGFVAAKAETCKVEKVATLPLTYSNGLAAVTARIDGVEVQMGVDTGSQTLVTPQTAARFGLSRDLSRKTRAIGTTAITTVEKCAAAGP